MSKFQKFKQSLSPVIAAILLLSISVIASVAVFNFTQDYFEQSQQQIDTDNQLFDSLNSWVVYSTLNETVVKLSTPTINISNVYLDGQECLGLAGFYNRSTLKLDIGLCANNLSTSNPKLIIQKTDNSILQYTLDIETVTGSLGTTTSDSRFNFGLGFNLSNASATFLGEAAEDQFGISLSAVGDINNDGYDDIVISADSNDDGGSNSGKLYVFFGRASGWSGIFNVSNANASFYGERAGNGLGLGASVDLGDVNGDGYDDIVAGAYAFTGNVTNQGKTYVIFGKSNGWSLNQNISSVANASFLGQNILDASGIAVSSSGDINNDGYNDIIIGAMFSSDSAANAGKVHLIFGKSSNWSQNISLNNANASFLGESGTDLFGAAVDSVDVNGDDFDDLILTTQNNDEGGSGAGQVYIVFGRNSGWLKDQGIISESNATFIGERGGDEISGRNGGDINNDGYGDILVSSNDNDEGGNDAGQVYVVFGGINNWNIDENISSRANASFIGAYSETHLGSGINRNPKDINGDGIIDLFISTQLNQNSNEAGEAYLIYGRASSSFWIMDRNISEVLDASFIGENSGDRSGISVSGGDVNGDGFTDVLIGAYFNDDSGNNSGKAYLIIS